MGRGDTKSARGKIFQGSFGKWRPRKKKKNGNVSKNTETRSKSGSSR